MPAKKGCTYSRDSKGRCRSAVAHYKHTTSSGKKKGCSYGRHNDKCLSKKAAESRKRSAAKRIQKVFRSRSRKSGRR
jgi:hypothetical protein